MGGKKYGLNISLNRVRATLVGINSNDRKIILRDGSELPYDLLVLATGKQYSGLVDNPIRGVEGLAFSEIVNDISEGDGIFVRSNNINALGFIQQLLERKIKPSQITLAYESDLEEIFDLGDINKERKLTNGPELDKVAARVRNEMKELGVELLENVGEYEIIKRNGKDISSVCVGDTEYECKHLVDMTAKSVSKTIFKALNDACLVYDGALVIDSTFSTSNENIMAAGPMTKYQRRLYADDWVHEKFNSVDVGRAAADLIVDRVLGRVPKTDVSVPVFKAPVVTSCKLVGGRHYLSCKATYFDRLADGMKQGQARWLVTSNDECDSRIHLNPFGIVDGMIFVSREPLNVENIIRIFGLHEKYLKDLVSRFDEELIPCLYEHITSPFFAVISHDRFKDLVQQLENLIPLDNDEIKPGTSKELTEKYSEDIDRTILNFIKDNQQLLPMYHLP